MQCGVFNVSFTLKYLIIKHIENKYVIILNKIVFVPIFQLIDALVTHFFQQSRYFTIFEVLFLLENISIKNS
jgi:hypothetical protein